MKLLKNIVVILLLVLSSNLFAQAKKQQEYPKPQVINFYKKDCKECSQLNSMRKNIDSTYTDKIEFTNIDVDIDDCDYIRLQNKYNINEVPTTVFLNAEFRLTKKVTGYIPQKLYLKNIKSIISY